MISQSTIERIQSAAQIQEVVSDYVTLRRRGVNLLGLCPFHSEKTPSFTVSPAKGIFKCFGCGKGGNAVHFIMEIEQLPYHEALRFLAKKYHIEIEETELTQEEKAARTTRESMLLVNDFAQKYFSEILHENADGRAVAMSYFKERGFREDIIKKFCLGYSLEKRDDFTQAALKANYAKDILVKTGLTIESEKGVFDRFSGRVMFPVHTLSGKVVAFGGRLIKYDKSMNTGKYLNSPESELYHKSSELYGIYFAKQAIVKQDRCLLVEGYTDVISLHQSGIENVVASSGTSLTTGQIRLIHRFTENITVVYDGDAAGIKASLRGIDMLLEEGMNIRVLLLPDGEDPDSFAQKNNAAELSDFIEKKSEDFIRFKIRILQADAQGDLHKRVALKKDVIQSIAIIPNALVRGEYVKESASLLEIDEEAVFAEINKIRKNQRENAAKEQQREAEKTENLTAEQIADAIEQSKKFENEERNLLRLILLYGSENIFGGADGSTITVAQYVFSEFERNALKFQNTVHRNFAKEYYQNMTLETFDAKKFFTFFPDAQISQFASDLLVEKHTLSKVHSKIKKIPAESERLPELTVRLVYELLNAHLLEKIRSALVRMKNASETDNAEVMNETMLEIKNLEDSKKRLAKELGERTIVKL